MYWPYELYAVHNYYIFYNNDTIMIYYNNKVSCYLILKNNLTFLTTYII